MLLAVFVTRHRKNRSMIGAVPAVSVHNARPSHLAFSRSANSSSPTPSRCQFALYYICNRSAMLHAVVGSLLLGIVIMVVGLVQLSPGAEAAQHRYYLLGAGAILIAVGVITAILRCVCLDCYSEKMQGISEEAQNAQGTSAKSRNGVESETRSILRSQASITSPRQELKVNTSET